MQSYVNIFCLLIVNFFEKALFPWSLYKEVAED